MWVQGLIQTRNQNTYCVRWEIGLCVYEGQGGGVYWSYFKPFNEGKFIINYIYFEFEKLYEHMAIGYVLIKYWLSNVTVKSKCKYQETNNILIL